MKDRIPTYPGRVTLTPVTGQANTFDMAMADSPTEAGTALNKANLLTDTVAAAIAALTSTTPDTPNEALAELAAAFTGRAKIETGSYTGTGTYGSSNLNSLTFGFVPKFVIVIEDHTASGTYHITNGLFVNPGRSGVYQYTSTGAGAALRLTWSNTTLSWYGTSALIQLNTNNRDYVYVAIG